MSDQTVVLAACLIWQLNLFMLTSIILDALGVK